MKALDEKARLRLVGRLAGLAYLIVFLTAGVAFYSALLIRPENPAVLAANIATHAVRFDLGITAWLVIIACYLVVTWLFYELFEGVNRSASLLAVFFGLVGGAIQGAACLLYVAPLTLLGGGHDYLSAFTPQQVQALAALSFRVYSRVYDLGLPFFGVYCVLIGCLLLESAFVPRVIGVLMIAAGFGWLTFLSPALAHWLTPYNALPGFAGEGSLTLWLVFRGVSLEAHDRPAGAPPR